MRRHLARWLGAAGCLALAACTVTHEPADTGSNNDTAASTPVVSDPGATAPDDASGTITEPDPSGLPSLGEPDDDLVEGTLDNGLRYVVRENDHPGARVSMRLVIDAGSVDETAEQSGVAHFLEHMLFNGTEEFPENDLVATLRSFGASFGADVNASTSYDETVYELTMPSDDPAVVETGVRILEQWLSEATLDPAQVEAERGVVLDEWRGSATDVSGRIYDEFEALLLAGSAYEGRDPIGTEAAIAAMTREPLAAFYDTWYRPDNAAVVVVGDIDADSIVELIDREFSPIVAEGALPERPMVRVEVPGRAAATVLVDPDLPEGAAAIDLPLVQAGPDGPASDEEAAQLAILDALAFGIVDTRLGNAALRGDAPFDDVYVDSSPIVRWLDSPEVVVNAAGADLEASTQAVFDELERVRRYGFSEAEVARAVATFRAGVDEAYAGRDSRQDADLADEYVQHVLIAEPVPTPDDEYDFVIAVLERATPATVAWGLVGRLDATEPQVMVLVPAAEAAEVSDEQVFVDQWMSLRDREIEPVADDGTIDDALMVAPDPVEPASRELLDEAGAGTYLDPVVLTFPNGVRVSINETPIAEGAVAFEGRSPGGLAVLADEDVPAGDAASAVIADSGVATYDPVSLDAFVSDKTVELQLSVDAFTEGLYGSSSTDDLETLFQLIHLQMSAPRVDPLAVDRYVDDELSYAADPSIDAGYAEFVTLLDARYDDPRFLLPTVDSLSTVEADGIEGVVRDRFGDASDWSFAFSGDLDVDEVVDLAARYLGTLPSSGRVERVTYAEPPPPSGIVDESVSAGTSAQANVSFLFTAPASTDRHDDVAAQVVQEIVTVRLTDVIREKLGESYSPYAMVQVGPGGAPNAETYLSTSTSVELIGSVRQGILGELADLRVNGPTRDEYASATETVRQALGLVSNEQINDEVLNVLTDPAGNPSFGDFLDQYTMVDELDLQTISTRLTDWLPLDHYISVTVAPR